MRMIATVVMERLLN